MNRFTIGQVSHPTPPRERLGVMANLLGSAGMNELQHHLSDLHAALQTAIDSTREIALLIREDPRLGASLANQNSRLGTFGDYITGQLFTLGCMENDVRRWEERLGELHHPLTEINCPLFKT